MSYIGLEPEKRCADVPFDVFDVFDDRIKVHTITPLRLDDAIWSTEAPSAHVVSGSKDLREYSWMSWISWMPCISCPEVEERKKKVEVTKRRLRSG